jgi:hypothetical protein
MLFADGRLSRALGVYKVILHMDIPNHYADVHHGFWAYADGGLPSSVSTTLPATYDRFLESVHFAELAVSILPDLALIDRINWYTSAHMAAYISIFDAARHDLSTLHGHITFEDTAVYKEMGATPNSSDPHYNDPLYANLLYRSIRNLRVHYSVPIVVLECRRITSDRPHWYMHLIEPSTYRLLRRSPLTDDQLNAYNAYLQKETIIDVFGRMLSIIRGSILETANLAAGDT